MSIRDKIRDYKLRHLKIGDYFEFDKKMKALELRVFSGLAEIFDDLCW